MQSKKPIAPWATKKEALHGQQAKRGGVPFYSTLSKPYQEHRVHLRGPQHKKSLARAGPGKGLKKQFEDWNTFPMRKADRVGEYKSLQRPYDGLSIINGGLHERLLTMACSDRAKGNSFKLKDRSD